MSALERAELRRMSSLPLPPSILFCLFHLPKGWPIKCAKAVSLLANDLPPSHDKHHGQKQQARNEFILFYSL